MSATRGARPPVAARPSGHLGSRASLQVLCGRPHQAAPSHGGGRRRPCAVRRSSGLRPCPGLHALLHAACRALHAFQRRRASCGMPLSAVSSIPVPGSAPAPAPSNTALKLRRPSWAPRPPPSPLWPPQGPPLPSLAVRPSAWRPLGARRRARRRFPAPGAPGTAGTPGGQGFGGIWGWQVIIGADSGVSGVVRAGWGRLAAPQAPSSTDSRQASSLLACTGPYGTILWARYPAPPRV